MIAQLLTEAGIQYTVAAGNNKLFKLSGGVLSELTYGGGGVAPTITDSNWQAASLNGILYLFQSGHDPLVFDPALSTTEYRRASEHAGYTGTVLAGDCAISAFGRIWTANSTTNKDTVYFSDLLSGMKWSGGTAGFYNRFTTFFFKFFSQLSVRRYQRYDYITSLYRDWETDRKSFV